MSTVYINVVGEHSTSVRSEMLLLKVITWTDTKIMKAYLRICKNRGKLFMWADSGKKVDWARD